MIDYAEALTVIDVNSGSFVGRGKQARLEDTITRTNLEAAEEVVNQLRLRDIGGIIVIDFIDMARASNRDAVLKTLRKTLDEDRTKTFTAEISKLGLVEMTRQNVTEGVREIMTRPLPDLRRRRRLLSEETIAIEFERRMRELASRAPREVEAFLHPHEPARQLAVHRQRRARAARAGGRDGQALPLRRLRGPAARPLRRHARGHATRRSASGRSRSARATRSRHHRRAAHVRRRRRGRQDRRLHHLRRRRRALVGEKRLVRIEEAGRTSATAVLVEGQPASPNGAKASSKKPARPRAPRRGPRRRRGGGPRRAGARRRGRRSTAEAGADEDAGPDEEAASGEDAVESKPRRRGRRGGRRRSAAKAETTSD